MTATAGVLGIFASFLPEWMLLFGGNPGRGAADAPHHQ